MPPTTHLTSLDCLVAGDETRVPDHECHEFGGIATDGEELQASFCFDKLFECRVGGNANSIMVSLVECLAELQKGLDVASTADDHDDNVHAWSRHFRSC